LTTAVVGWLLVAAVAAGTAQPDSPRADGSAGSSADRRAVESTNPL